ncbi:MAG: valine--tRNA ligase [Bryobacteraceae bacterium]
MQIEKVYEPQLFEPHWAKWWIETGIFHADADAPGPRFSMVIPPPNVTGALHMGHMLDHTIMDTATRWHRMRGENTLWLPGTDHAGISTQVMVERLIATEGKTRHDLGREEFERRVWLWREQYGGRILQQMQRIGDSVDWSRLKFTLDPDLSKAVTEAFVLLYERGLIYRGAYMVNWCPDCQTALSDLEVIHKETQGSMWHIRYPVNGSSESLVVATTRPETMLGDTAVAVNPNDERYKHLAGKTVLLPLMNRHIPIIFDDLAQPEFGTGVVKVTPAHDPNDLEAGKRHDLPHVQVIDYNAKMTEAAGPYAGLDRFVARERIVEDLKTQGYLVKIEPHTLSIGTCQRSKTIVEPLVSTQWFLRMKPLAEKAKAAVEEGRIQFIPENWNKTYFHWMDTIRDWCISRQLWWGHRIPAWHCAEFQHITVARTEPEVCAHCGSPRIEQDNDVLDTWFSSGLWPFSTLGWPELTKDLATYYPTSLLITGFDILFFWVARMIMMGIELTGQVPYRQVHMHGLVRDADKQKMSKTKGNVVDPLVITEKYGTDAFRMALLISAGAGSDIAYSEDRVVSARAFANKIWNAARLLFGIDQTSRPAPAELSLEDRWIRSRVGRVAEEANRAFEQHRYHEAAHALWHSFWGDFCDWYLEVKKLTPDWNLMSSVFESYLRLLHPVMPFITEELWHRMGHEDSIALAPYPKAEGIDEAAEHDMALLQEVITAARTIRADHNIDKKLVLEGQLYCRNGAQAVAESHLDVVQRLANVKLAVTSEAPAKLDGAMRSTPDFDLLLETPKADVEAQRARLLKETEQLEKLIADKDRQLSNEKFLSSAPAKIVGGLREKRAEYQAQLDKNRSALDDLH